MNLFDVSTLFDKPRFNNLVVFSYSLIIFFPALFVISYASLSFSHFWMIDDAFTEESMWVLIPLDAK